MQPQSVDRSPFVIGVPVAPPPAPLPVVVTPAPAPVPVPVKKPFSSVDSLRRELRILNTVQPLALAGCAVAYGVTEALNPNSLGEALVCLSPFVMGIAGPMVAVKLESLRRARHERADR